MQIRPLLLGGAGLLALQLLTVDAAPVMEVDPPKGWSVSESVGKQYKLGYDPGEQAYFIESSGPINPAGTAVNANSVPFAGPQRVPYSVEGLKDTDPWSAAILQSVKAGPYRKHKVRFEAEVRSGEFHGQLQLVMRLINSKGIGSTTVDASDGNYTWHVNALGVDTGTVQGNNWHTIAGDIDQVPDYEIKGSDDDIVTFGFLLQGEGRVMVRNARLIKQEYTPEAPHETHLNDMFANPEPNEQPINLELHR